MSYFLGSSEVNSYQAANLVGFTEQDLILLQQITDVIKFGSFFVVLEYADDLRLITKTHTASRMTNNNKEIEFGHAFIPTDLGYPYRFRLFDADVLLAESKNVLLARSSFDKDVINVTLYDMSRRGVFTANLERTSSVYNIKKVTVVEDEEFRRGVDLQYYVTTSSGFRTYTIDTDEAPHWNATFSRGDSDSDVFSVYTNGELLGSGEVASFEESESESENEFTVIAIESVDAVVGYLQIHVSLSSVTIVGFTRIEEGEGEEEEEDKYVEARRVQNLHHHIQSIGESVLASNDAIVEREILARDSRIDELEEQLRYRYTFINQDFDIVTTDIEHNRQRSDFIIEFMQRFPGIGSLPNFILCMDDDILTTSWDEIERRIEVGE